MRLVLLLPIKVQVNLKASKTVTLNPKYFLKLVTSVISFLSLKMQREFQINVQSDNIKTHVSFQTATL